MPRNGRYADDGRVIEFAVWCREWFDKLNNDRATLEEKLTNRVNALTSTINNQFENLSNDWQERVNEFTTRLTALRTDVTQTLGSFDSRVQTNETNIGALTPRVETLEKRLKLMGGCRLERVSPWQTLRANEWDRIRFNAQVYDAGQYDNGDGRIICRSAGFYLIIAGVRFGSGSDSRRQVRVMSSSGAEICQETMTSTWGAASMSALAHLQANELIEVVAFSPDAIAVETPTYISCIQLSEV